MSHFEIRLMTEADADAVRRLDQKAFGAWMRQRDPNSLMPLRTLENALSLLGRDPEGCFVAEVEERPVGYVFSRTWGRVGWFGTLGVHPQFQGQSIGRALVEASVAYLDQHGCTTIGLGTMAEEANNVGLYAHCGFRPDHLTVILAFPSASAPFPKTHTRFSELSPQSQEQILQGPVPRISAGVRPGLDYSPEVRAAARDGYGETLLMGDLENPWGFVVARTRSKWESRLQMTLNVEAGALAEGAEDRLGDLLVLLSDFAAENGLSRVLLPVNSHHWAVVEKLLGLGCRVYHTRLRMIFRQQAARSTAADLATWAA